MKKRFPAILLAILMFICLLSMTAFAAEGEPTVTAAELVYDGQAQALVSADVPEGYTMYYAVKTKPASTKDAGWGDKVPTAKDAGTYTVWYYAKDADGKDTEINEIQVTISPMELQDGELTAKVSNPPTYTGAAQKPSPSVSVKVSGKSYSVKPGDYTAEYANNVNAGDDTASVTLKAAEGGNYIFKDVTVPFSINKATVNVLAGSVKLAEASRTYDPADYSAEVKIAADEGYVTVRGVNNQHLIIKSVSGSVKYNNAGSQTVTVKATEVDYIDGAEAANYNAVQFADRPILTIEKAEITDKLYKAPTARTLVESENAAPQQLVDAGSTPGDTVMLYHLVGDSAPWSNSVYGITGSEAEKTYTVEYYIRGDKNYLDGGSEETPLGSVNVTIEKAAPSTGSVISGGSIAIIVVIAVVAAGAVAALVITKKKRSAN